ncbi:hypothetical protein Tco_0477305 [Tanacetum coccineum]
MQAAHDRQKSYADLKCKLMEFQVGDRVMLKVSPWKGVVCFCAKGGSKQHLAMFWSPFKVLGNSMDAHFLTISRSQELRGIISCIATLKKCLFPTNHIKPYPIEDIHVDDKLRFIEEPVNIMDREVKRLKQSRIPIVKVRWNSRRGPEFTWEREDQFQKKYPASFH